MPNATYSGSPKPTITAFVEVPFTDDAAEFNQIRAGGPNALTIANLPATYAPQSATVEAEGYALNKANSYSFNFFPLNLNNPKVGPVFRQTYFRQALQHLIDQPGWINAFLHNTATETVSPIPVNPPSPLVTSNASANPFAFSTSAASRLLSSHGWKVAPGGKTTCATPGTGTEPVRRRDHCGRGDLVQHRLPIRRRRDRK